MGVKGGSVMVPTLCWGEITLCVEKKKKKKNLCLITARGRTERGKKAGLRHQEEEDGKKRKEKKCKRRQALGSERKTYEVLGGRRCK